ncbi:MAG: folylpolyglutamate synthase/dihydrofolate synthase family protein [Ginsengibacter sp.]
MNYEQALNYLYNKLHLFSRMGAKAYKADLKNTLTLCDFLDNPQQRIKSIHVAGTNGKGSTSHMLAAIFQQNGYKTGLYTSPHLKDFRERIKINGNMIPETFVISFLEKTKAISEEIKPSFFELTFVMALDYFAHEKVEVAIIETGLGGRLDSTNVITPLISVITNISFDHMDILGDTLAKIAFEKAGIIKPNIPVVIGETHPETKIVFQNKSQETQSPIIFADEEYKISSSNFDADSLKIELLHPHSGQKEKYQLDLNGLYQEKNLLAVVTAIDLLKKHFPLKEENIKKALSTVKKLTGLHGRWEVIHKNPLVVLDVAHNEGGIKQLILQVSKIKFSRLHIVFGMVKDKDIQKALAQLPKNAIYYFTKAQIPRALTEKELQAKAGAHQLIGTSYPYVKGAVNAAMEAASKEDLVIVCGSVFVVAEVEESMAAYSLI